MQAKFGAETLVLLKDKTSWYCIDVSVHGIHLLLIYKK